MNRNYQYYLFFCFIFIIVTGCTEPDENIIYGLDNPNPWLPNTAVAQLDSIVPNYDYPTKQVTIRGTGFDTRLNEYNFVWFENARAEVQSVWQDSLYVTVPVPQPLDFFFTDTVQVKMSLQGSYNWSNNVPFVFKPMAHQYLALTYPPLHPEDKFTKPRGLEFDQNGNLYLINARLRSIYLDTPVAGDRTLFSFGAKYEGGLRFGPDGYLYAAAFTGSEIIRVSPDGSSYETWMQIPNPWGIDFDEQGNLFVVDIINSDVYKISPQKIQNKIVDLPGQNATSYCRYHAGEIYLNAYSNAAVYHFSSQIDSLTSLDTLEIEDVQYINDIIFDELGNMYITGGESKINALFKISPAGEVTKMVELGSELTFMVYHDKFLYVSRLDGPVFQVLVPEVL